MTYPIITDEYTPPLKEYEKADLEPYVPFIPFTRKSRWQLGHGVRGRYFPGSGQIDLLDDAHDETEEIAMHEAGHARNPSASEPDIRQNTRNKLKNSVWH